MDFLSTNYFIKFILMTFKRKYLYVPTGGNAIPQQRRIWWCENVCGGDMVRQKRFLIRFIICLILWKLNANKGQKYYE